MVLQHYMILRFVSKILCPGMSLTCLDVHVTPRRQKSFTSPLVFHRMIQFLLSRLEIAQLLHVIESKTLGTNLIAISLLKLTSTTFVAPPHILFTTSEKLRTFYRDLLWNVLSSQCICFFNTWFLQQPSLWPSLLRVKEITMVFLVFDNSGCKFVTCEASFTCISVKHYRAFF